MQPQTFDHLTRLARTRRSRRTIWSVILGLVLGGAPMVAAGRNVRSAPAKPCDGKRPCDGDRCCGGECCPGHCFKESESGREFCCVKPEYEICRNLSASNRQERQVCCPVDTEAPCGCAEGGGLAGSYRRPR